MKGSPMFTVIWGRRKMKVIPFILSVPVIPTGRMGATLRSGRDGVGSHNIYLTRNTMSQADRDILLGKAVAIEAVQKIDNH